jgi:hypothetical protein
MSFVAGAAGELFTLYRLCTNEKDLGRVPATPAICARQENFVYLEWRAAPRKKYETFFAKAQFCVSQITRGAFSKLIGER